MDAEDWHKNSESEHRFREAVARLMANVDARYGKLNSGNNKPYDLYSLLRGGMAHVLRPKGDFAFVGAGTAAEKGLKHLEINPKSGKMTLVAENFFEDFSSACNIVLHALPKLEANPTMARKRHAKHPAVSS